MKTHVADNLLLFRKHFNALYHHIRNRERNKEKYQLVETRSGSANLCVHREDGEYYLHSKYDPVREANMWVEQLGEEIQAVQQVVFYGLGLGYHLESFLDKYPDKSIYLYEPDAEIILAAMEARNLGKILKHNKIVVFGFGSEKHASDQFIHTFIEQVSQDHRMVVTPGYQRPYAEMIKSFHEEFRRAVLLFRGNLHTFIAFREEWPENIINNMVKNISCPPLSSLEQVAKGKPVVIVGSGPSLDVDKDYLKTMAEHALVFAAGTSIRALLAHDIIPDMIFSIDGSEKNYQAFQGLNYEDIPMTYAPTVRYKIIKQKRKNLYHVVMRNDSLSTYLLPDESSKHRFFSTTSVTGTALQTAALFGCDPVILMGQDLSYPGGRLYSGKVDHFSKEEQQQQLNKATLKVENVQGGENEISRPMLNTLRDMETAISIFNRDSRVINTSKLGAKIKHTEFMPIEDVLQTVTKNRLDKQFYYDKLESVSGGYSSSVKLNTYNKMMNTKKLLEEIGVDCAGLLQLLEDFDRTHNNKLQSAITKVNDQWLHIVKNQVFENVVSMCIETQLHTYKRYLPQILEASDLRKKSELIKQYMGLVVGAAHSFIPKLCKYLDDSMQEYRLHDSNEWAL